MAMQKIDVLRQYVEAEMGGEIDVWSTFDEELGQRVIAHFEFQEYTDEQFFDGELQTLAYEIYLFLLTEKVRGEGK